MSEEKSPADKPETSKSAPGDAAGEKGKIDAKTAPKPLPEATPPAGGKADKKDAPKPDAKDEVKPSLDKKPSAPPAAKKPSGGFGAGLIGGIFGGLLVIGGAGGVFFAMQDRIRSDFIDPEIARASDGQSATLKAAFEGRLKEIVDLRIAALEQDADSFRRALDSQDGAIGRLREQVAARQSAPLPPQPAQPSVDPAALRAMDQRLSDLAVEISSLKLDLGNLRNALPQEGALLRLSERAEQTETAFRDLLRQRNVSQALLLNVAQLKLAIDAGTPYATELRLTKELASSDSQGDIDALAQNQDKGVPTRVALIESFPPIAIAAVQANRTAKDGDIWGQIQEHASRLVMIRSVDPSGEGTESIIARAEKAVSIGDLDAALRELSTLPSLPAAAAQSWVDSARARLDADSAISRLANAAIAASVAEKSAN